MTTGVKPGRTARDRILKSLWKTSKGLTSAELERRLNLSHPTTASALNYFLSTGQIIIVGHKYNRITRRQSRIYKFNLTW